VIICKSRFLLAVSLFASVPAAAQTTTAPAASAIWNQLTAGSMDPAKFAHTENVVILRDRVHITLVDGTIQLTAPANGAVFGAVFHGEGKLQVEPPTNIEAQQLQLFTKQSKVDMTFTEATFSFSDSLPEELGKQVKWLTNSAFDDLYAKRQRERIWESRPSQGSYKDSWRRSVPAAHFSSQT
jgi:hypothetical protein